MRTLISPFLLLALLATQCRNATPRPAPIAQKSDSTPKRRTLFFSDSGTSFITLKRDTAYGFPGIEHTSRAQSWHFVSFTGYGTDNRVIWYALIRELSLQHIPSAPDGERKGSITLTTNIPNINPIEDTCNLYRVDWQTRVPANEVNYRETYIEAVTWQGENRLKTLIDYRTGQPLIELTSSLYGVQLPNGYARRWIGYADKEGLGFPYDTVGVLSYVDPISHRAQRLVIGGVDLPFYKEEEFAGLCLEGVRNRPGDPNFKVEDNDSGRWYYSDCKRFYIVIRFDGRKKLSLRIPVLGDKIDISHLSPDWCSLEIK